MQFFEHLQRLTLARNARFWGKECARRMVLSFLVKKTQYETSAPSFAWLAMQAMLARTRWVQVGETTLMYDRSGETVEIPDDSNLKFAIHKVIEVEYGYEIASLLRRPVGGCADVLREAHDAAEKYLTRKSLR
jgi:hypothetical protein